MDNLKHSKKESPLKLLKQLAKIIAKATKECRKSLENAQNQEITDNQTKLLCEKIQIMINSHESSKISIEDFIQAIPCSLFLLRLIKKDSFPTISLSEIFTPFLNVQDPFPNIQDLNLKPIIEILQSYDIESLISQYYATGAELDIVTYFYQEFLQYYNKEQKNQKGIFHTPTSIVSFIIRGINYLLINEFNLKCGLSDAHVQILDPAMGTGTFLEYVLRFLFCKSTHHSPLPSYSLGRNHHISDHLLDRLLGFEVLLTPYILAQQKLQRLLHEIGFPSSFEPHFRLFLDNSLSSPMIFDEMKNTLISNASPHILVILGNPPYSRSSKNTTPFIERLMESYKRDVRQEKNIQPLSDDYIKFLRLSQELVERNGCGIIGMITNHTYLSGIIHRGLRKELMRVFDKIYVVDLHGSKIIDENIAESTRDENIFGIKQGSCIIFLVKRPQKSSLQLFLYDLFGTKTHKFQWLRSNSISTIPWTKIKDLSPGEPFKAQCNLIGLAEYKNFLNLTDIFKFYNVGGKPGDDRLLVSLSQDTLRQNLEDFIEHRKQTPKTRNLTEAKRKFLRIISEYKFDASRIEPYNYRPFDIRWTYYDPQIWTRPVQKLKHQCKNNLLLLCSRIVKDRQFAHVFIADLFTDVIFLSNTSSVNCYVFPLYWYELDGKQNWNLSSSYLKFLQDMGIDIQNMGSTLPLAYIYAILNSHKYRIRYSPYLKRTFPSIPLIRDKEVFRRIVLLGEKLSTLHLQTENLKSSTSIESNVLNGDIIRNGFPKFTTNRVYISPQKWFEDVEEDVWNHRIGKYKVCKKWLNDRRNQPLTDLDVHKYTTMLEILKQTLQIIQQIDEVLSFPP